MRYRREIDGLRAIAVLPVIGFHAGVDHFSGGYVGVDVFFVISGFLIGTLVIEELEAGTFSIAGFYERRARRILPALFLVLACCLAAAWVTMTPGDLKDFAVSTLSVLFFVSNLHFLGDVGYFEDQAAIEPLLHTWSLAIEEQYYLLVPFLSVRMWKRGKRAFATGLVVLAVASFAVAAWGHVHQPTANFYFTPSRVWELLVGAIGAFALRERRWPPGELPALAGLAAIVCSILVYDQWTPFPSHYTLLPVAGTALVLIWGREGTLVARLLSWRPLVGIGLISYSAYLWHQPVLVFVRKLDLQPAGAWLGLTVLAILALAWASWRFVEQPFRKRAVAATRRRMLAASLAGGLVLAALAGLVAAKGGFPGRTALSGVAFADLRLDERLAANRGLDRRCGRAGRNVERCRTSDAPRYALWGDSFAMQLAVAMVAGKPDIEMAQYTRSYCAPVQNAAVLTAQHDLSEAMDCIAFNAWALAEILASPTIENVVLSTAYSPLHGSIVDADGHADDTGREARLRALVADTARVLREHGKRAVLVSPAPSNQAGLGACVERVLTLGLPRDRCDFPLADMSDFVRANHDMTVSLEPVLPVVWLDDLVCEEGVCDTLVGDTIVYRDDLHLSIEGAARLGAERGLMDRIDAALEPGGRPGRQ